MPGLGAPGWPELLLCSACGAVLLLVVVTVFALLRWSLMR